MTKEELFKDNMKLVHYVLHHAFVDPKGIARKHRMEYEDLVQVGYYALWKACKNFCPEKELKFSTYAYITIYGHILNYLKRNGHLMKVNYDTQEVEEIHSVQFYEISLPIYKGHSTMFFYDLIPSEENVEQKVITKDFIERATKILNENQKKIFLMSAEGMQVKDIARQLNISRKSISATLQRVYRKIRKELQLETK